MKFRLVERIGQRYLIEGTRYDEQAAKIISNSGLFDEETSKKIIDALFREDIHAFSHAPAWLEKYLKGIARMLVEESNGDKSRAKSFLEESPSVFEQYLTWVKANREKVGNSLDSKFVNEMRYQDVKDFLEKIQQEQEEQSKKELDKMKFDTSNYSLVPIESFEQFNRLYGGRATGDGSSNKYAGGGGTAWCHTNSRNVYDSWTSDGKKFFVLQNNNWRYIPFNLETNRKASGKDDYGNSLIAIRVDKRGRLLNATLRCNHVGVNTNADNQYNTYAELSKVAGFNVEEEVEKYIEMPKEIEQRVIKMFGKDCRIQRVKDNIWDFLDLPIMSKVYNSFEEAEVLNKDRDGKDNLLTNEVLPKLREELRKSLNIGKCWIPTKKEYESLFPSDEDRVKYMNGRPYWYWTSSPSIHYYAWYYINSFGEPFKFDADYRVGVSCAFEIIE